MNNHQKSLLLICLSVCFGVLFLMGAGSQLVAADTIVPSDSVPVTCTVASVDSGTNRFLDCVNNGGINTAVDYRFIPTGKYLFVTDINIVPTQVFTTATPAMMRLTRYTGSGGTNIIYEMRITDSNSKHTSFTTPIIRLNPGDSIYAENLTANSFTNDLRVYVTGWLTSSDIYVPTAINGLQSSAQPVQTQMPLWLVALLAVMMVTTAAQYWQMRHLRVPINPSD